MRLKIISDGTLKGTQVVDTETGKRLEGVHYISWEIDADGEAHVHLGLDKISVEMEGVLEKVMIDKLRDMTPRGKA